MSGLPGGQTPFRGEKGTVLDRRRLGGHPDPGARLAHRRQAGADRDLSGDEARSPGGAARLGVVVGEAHPLRRHAIEVRRAARHDTAVVRTDVEPPDVVTHMKTMFGFF